MGCPDAAAHANKYGDYPLHHLCINWSVTAELLEAFLGRCPDAAAHANKYGHYPLHHLCINGSVTAELFEAFHMPIGNDGHSHRFGTSLLGRGPDAAAHAN